MPIDVTNRPAQTSIQTEETCPPRNSGDVVSIAMAEHILAGENGGRILTRVDRYVFILTLPDESADADMLICMAESMNQSKGD